MTDDVKAKLKAIITEIAEIDDVPEDTPFVDLGIDSMMAIEIVSDVEREFQISIDENELSDLTNFRAVLDKVQDKLAN
ncbi:MAG: acyl carrier protein [Polyangiales bacterium]